MKNAKNILFYGHLAQKTAQPARLRPPFLYLTPLFPRKYAAISPYFPFLEAPGKVPGRLLVLALRRARTHFFSEKISDK